MGGGAPVFILRGGRAVEHWAGREEALVEGAVSDGGDGGGRGRAARRYIRNGRILM